MQKFVIIVAGGSGTRMGSEIPKQFLLLNEKPILMHTLDAFISYSKNIKIILVLPELQVPMWNSFCGDYDYTSAHQVVNGGETRFQSVKNGLASIKADNALVAVHDGVRPLISNEVIANTFEAAEKFGSGIAAVPLKDSIRKIEGDQNKAVDRNQFWAIQTPQTFNLAAIKKAYATTFNASFTDDATVMEKDGNSIHLVNGDYKNIKITTTEDLIIAAAFLQE
jgi:2-C-methyl-D-erythritol 4-phosphate cytidylyltransferase